MARHWLGVAAVVAGLAGCAAPARYVEQHDDSGIVAIPENSDTFPSYSRSEAISLIEKHVGPNYEILEERPVVAPRRNIRNQHAQTEHVPMPGRIAPSAPIGDAQPSEGTHEVTEWRIAYRKRSATWIGENNPGGATASKPTTTPASTSNGIQQAQGIAPAVPQPDSLIPSVAPILPACGCADGRCNGR